jgi:hypothetical protein
VKRICTQQIALHSINRGGSCRAKCFRNGRRRPDPRRRRQPCRRDGCGRGGANAREPATIERHNAAFIEGGRSNVSRQRRYGPSHAGTGHKFRPDGTGLWNRPYTL